MCFDGVCHPVGCGNGQLEDGEVCDDGNREHGDGCNADCTSDETCGNGFVDIARGESCDDGDNTASEACGDACIVPTCGDGIVDTLNFEGCDEGGANSNAPDAICRVNCQPQRCGDGILDAAAGETCDDGNFVPGDGCSGGCDEELCGNAQIDLIELDNGTFVPGEECDTGEGLSFNHDGCTQTCALETPAWNDMFHIEPGARHSHTMVYIATLGTMFEFGGQDAFGKVDETWQYDGATGTWTELLPDSNLGPTGRQQPNMAYDAARNKVVLFGGFPGTNANDTWEFDIATSTWSQIFPVGDSPSPRNQASMVYDSARKKIVLFGGTDNTVNNAETWEYDGPTSTWTNVTPAGVSPSPRSTAGMVYDPIRDRILIWGGNGAGSDLSVWEYEAAAATWTQVAPQTATPSARRMFGMVFDSGREKVYVFGGFAPALSDELWEYDAPTASWTQITPNGIAPAARSRFAMAFDTARQKLVVFGGQVGSTFNNETWEYDGATQEWLQVSPTTGPGGRRDQVMAYDTARGLVVMFSGSGGADETWEFSGRSRRWTRVFPAAPVPTAREGAGMVYDSAEEKFVMFGGFQQGVSISETWTYDAEARTWEERTGSASVPPIRKGHSMAYDASRNVVVLFGGADVVVDPDTGARIRTNRDDTWEYDTATDSWTEVVIPGAAPAARREFGMAYDPIRRKVILFGGFSNFFHNDTWEFDGATGTWTEIAPVGPLPPPRALHAMVFNHQRRAATFYGGNNSGIESDVYEYDSTAQRWTDVTPTGSPARSNKPVMANDNLGNGLLLFGGLQTNGLNASDTLLFQHTLGGLREACQVGHDADGDGLQACADPDCWGYCTPDCSPGSTLNWPTDCDTSLNACGDGVCNTHLETPRLCPSDCGLPATVCGDFLCEAGEDLASCPGDCAP